MDGQTVERRTKDNRRHLKTFTNAKLIRAPVILTGHLQSQKMTVFVVMNLIYLVFFFDK